MSIDGPRPQHAELGFYGLAGHTDSPRDLLDEVRTADDLGLGSVFLSERYSTKDAGVLTGAAAASSERIGVATAATNHNTRHVLVTATMAVTAHRMSHGRFALGLGRGFDVLFDLMDLPRITSAQMTDAVDLLRRLWRGESIIDHDGPAGRFPFLRLQIDADEDIPIVLVAIGDATLRLAGQIADGVVLHTFLTDDTVARQVGVIRDAAQRVGRDPGAIRIWSVLATVGDWVPEPDRTRRIVGRLATYLQGYGDLLVRTNGWDRQRLADFRADERVQAFRGAFDADAAPDDIAHLSALLPAEWTSAAATGSAAHCARRILDQFDAGVDSVILHGATPAEIAPLLPAWSTLAPQKCARAAANPGRLR